MGNRFYVKEFPSTTDAIAEALTEALDALAAQEWINPEHTFSVRLCLEEALVNAVVHGNQNRAESSVLIEIHDEGEMCRVRVQDEGYGFKPEKLEMPDCRQMGGRGVCLIKEFMDDVRFDVDSSSLEMLFSRTTFSKAFA